MTSVPRDPVGTHLIRSTSPAPTPGAARPDHDVPRSRLASEVPVRPAGTRSRAGNAMGRTRQALLRGAAAAVAAHGTRVTMAEVATAAGVAKATLYNHLRTREEVLQAVLANEVLRVCAQTRDLTVADALTAAATAISAHPIRRGLARSEPDVLARLARVDPDVDGWRLAGAEVTRRLQAVGRGGTESVLRLLSSYLTTPADPANIRADVDVLLNGLPSA
ncbi:MAG TPA: helix-turn-helix domain-containing protein [Jatrophihabitantaceae bacterium]|jgi:AcrR family transcriptional regulator|nr:helix-turn-helix domain-containing protein [Jatrophihabitantaceae bacterium]